MDNNHGKLERPFVARGFSQSPGRSLSSNNAKSMTSSKNRNNSIINNNLSNNNNNNNNGSSKGIKVIVKKTPHSYGKSATASRILRNSNKVAPILSPSEVTKSFLDTSASTSSSPTSDRSESAKSGVSIGKNSVNYGNNNSTFIVSAGSGGRPNSSTSKASSKGNTGKTFPSGASRGNLLTKSAQFSGNAVFRSQVERCMKEHKVFYIVGVYPAIRNALKKRGWVEKHPSLGISRPTYAQNAFRELEVRHAEDKNDQTWLNRVLRDYPPDFIWVIRRDNLDWKAFHRDQIVNRFPRAQFTTKVGISACLQNMHWFSEAGVSDTFFPRCYRLCIDEEKNAFVEDYRLSACMGLLKWVVKNFEKDGEAGVLNSSSRVTSLCVDFAVRQINNYVRMRRHEDIDWLMPPSFMAQHWDYFLQQYHAVVVGRGKLFPVNATETAKAKYESSKKALSRITPYWPQSHLDGFLNIWICKPGARSRGKGIVILNQLDKIMDLLNHSNYREANWVVQKYMERPLLIYKTKFDIRQWFIVTDWAPLTVWFYKESYVRFCTKPFTLEDFHESVHLCNNAVQCRYTNSNARDSSLPDENMWDCYSFQAYLKMIGKLDLWDSLIYPAMKEGVLGVLLASQETVDMRKNCFELFGADFMLDEEFRPWLIEINSCPCMAPSTSVTARMCAQCLEDTVKVVVDRRENKNADTGMFELIYKMGNNKTNMQFNISGADLVVQGKKMTKDVDWPSILAKYNSKKSLPTTSTTSTSTATSASINNIGRSKNGTSVAASQAAFMDLVQRLRLKEDSDGSQSSASVRSNINTYIPPNNKENKEDEIAIGTTKSASVNHSPTLLGTSSSLSAYAQRLLPPPPPSLNHNHHGHGHGIVQNKSKGNINSNNINELIPTITSVPKLKSPKGPKKEKFQPEDFISQSNNVIQPQQQQPNFPFSPREFSSAKSKSSLASNNNNSNSNNNNTNNSNNNQVN